MTVELSKRTEAATVSLTKIAQSSTVDLGDVELECELAIDYSVSMGGRYPDEVQEVVERCLGMMLTGLDPDGKVPVHFFHSKPFDAIVATENNYKGLVADFASKHAMGGTNYSGTLKNILGKSKRKEADQTPTLCVFVTDGAPSYQDRDKIEKVLVEARTRPFFFQFVMVGNDPGAREYLRSLNEDLTGKGIDNVGVTYYADTSQLTDEQFFDDVLSEVLPQWLPAARKEGITNK